MAPPPVFPGMPVEPAISLKSRTTAGLLCFFLGWAGAHRFYVGKTGSAIIMLIWGIVGTIIYFVWVPYVLSLLGLWVLIDFIMILIGRFKDKNGLLITK
jgi:TM2 domain-containing membrane protein YozV